MEKVNVPDAVTGEPETLNSAGAERATLVTLPEPAPSAPLAAILTNLLPSKAPVLVCPVVQT